MEMKELIIINFHSFNLFIKLFIKERDLYFFESCRFSLRIFILSILVSVFFELVTFSPYTF